MQNVWKAVIHSNMIQFSIMFIGVNLNVFILIVVIYIAIEIIMIIIEILKKFYYRTALF